MRKRLIEEKDKKRMREQKDVGKDGKMVAKLKIKAHLSPRSETNS
jgi:hypothetical protein